MGAADRVRALDGPRSGVQQRQPAARRAGRPVRRPVVRHHGAGAVAGQVRDLRRLAQRQRPGPPAGAGARHVREGAAGPGSAEATSRVPGGPGASCAGAGPAGRGGPITWPPAPSRGVSVPSRLLATYSTWPDPAARRSGTAHPASASDPVRQTTRATDGARPGDRPLVGPGGRRPSERIEGDAGALGILCVSSRTGRARGRGPGRGYPPAAVWAARGRRAHAYPRRVPAESLAGDRLRGYAPRAPGPVRYSWRGRRAGRREAQMREAQVREAPGAAGGPAAFAGRLRRLRLGVGLTQEALAERAGLGVRTVQALEEGESWPRRTTVLRLAQALRLDRGRGSGARGGGVPAGSSAPARGGRRAPGAPRRAAQPTTCPSSSPASSAASARARRRAAGALDGPAA